MILILLLSFGSGAAALIYEIVWFQMLELSIGSTAVALAVVLAMFMGGLCLGSVLFPRLVPARHRPLRVYAGIEAGIGIWGIAAMFLIPFAGGVYTGWAASGVVAAVCLLPPTLFMGATLPALSREPEEARWLGVLYGVNIGGAVLGCLLAGFYLLREYDVTTAASVAAAINFGMALIAVAARGRSITVAARNEAGGGDRPVYWTIALSGFCALAAEAIWTRTLGLLFGASVYTLSLIVGVFLMGLGIGSGAGSLLSRFFSPRLALGWCQWLLAGAIAWASWVASASLPYWPIDPSLTQNVWFNFQLDLARALWALLPATILWGASFSFALAAAAPGAKDSGRLMAGVYAANTLGAIGGALAASLLLIGWVGSQRAEQFLIAVCALSALLLLPRRSMAAACVLVSCGLCIYAVPPLSKFLVAYGRYAASWAGKTDIVYAREGMNSSVAVSKFPEGTLTFHVAGKIQASNVPRDMRLQRMLGHLTTLTAAHPRSLLVIGCGAGITAGAVSIDPQVERETIVEIEPLVPQAAAAYFGEPNFNVLHNPKVQLRIDDGRHFLLTSKETFDGITVDPLDPWVKGAANLYTREFFEVMRQHLNPGGTVTMYIQLFETNLDAVKSALATFFEVFPNGTVWGNTYQGRGHDMVLLGQAEPLRIDLDAMEQRIDYRGDSKLARSLAEVGMNSPVDLFATYAGRASDLKQWLKGAEMNRDRNLRMEYLAGFGLNADDSAAIYASMLAYRRFPLDIFASAEGRVDSLRRAVEHQP